MPTQIPGDAVARRASDACADFLDRHHQRIGQQHRPADAVTELRTGLAVGPDARYAPVIRPGPSLRRNWIATIRWNGVGCFLKTGTEQSAEANWRGPRSHGADE